MDITVIRPSELSVADRGTWQQFQAADPEQGNPFLSPRFTRAVGRLRPAARVAVLSDGSDPVGFFPFERHALGAGRPIGSGFCDCQGLVHASGLQWDATELLRACGLVVWEFNHLTAGQAPFEGGTERYAASPVIGLDAGYDAYQHTLQRRSPDFLRKLRAKERRLTSEAGDLHLSYETSPDLLDTLIRWKSAQYHAKGYRDHFAHPFTAALLREMLHSPGDGAEGMLSVLYAGGQPVACQYSLRSPRVLAFWFTAYDVRFARFSPGVLLSLKICEAAAGQGIRLINLGRGEDQTKKSLKTAELTVGEGRVERRAARAALHRYRSRSVDLARDFTAGHPALRDAALRTVQVLDARHRT
ncbi:GNAT family N-acetyltransferase [Streptacidiphilus sp. EB129]|uniref:GNAT family N-acetyltransferase n=1 Tax=Streptacidiphilus sp. EB129 TaxID=3156262 RepID=UPI0035132851